MIRLRCYTWVFLKSSYTKSISTLLIKKDEISVLTAEHGIQALNLIRFVTVLSFARWVYGNPHTEEAMRNWYRFLYDLQIWNNWTIRFNRLPTRKLKQCTIWSKYNSFVQLCPQDHDIKWEKWITGNCTKAQSTWIDCHFDKCSNLHFTSSAFFVVNYETFH